LLDSVSVSFVIFCYMTVLSAPLREILISSFPAFSAIAALNGAR